MGARREAADKRPSIRAIRPTGRIGPTPEHRPPSPKETAIVVVQSVVGCLAAVVGMMIVMGMVRLAANLVIVLLALAACGVVVHSIQQALWNGWGEIVWASLATGALTALLSLPVLPFSSFRRKR